MLVAEDDPAFAEPTKPVGPFYPEEQARGLERDRGWQVVHDAGRGWRRVVPSPLPLEVVELEAIRTLLASGTIVVACGGGGIPATRRGKHLAGIDAVIDKDRATSLLARELGADRLVILTEVPAVAQHAAREPVRDAPVAVVELGESRLVRASCEGDDGFVRKMGEVPRHRSRAYNGVPATHTRRSPYASRRFGRRSNRTPPTGE